MKKLVQRTLYLMVWALAAAFVYNSFTLNTFFFERLQTPDQDSLSFRPIQMIQITCGQMIAYLAFVVLLYHF